MSRAGRRQGGEQQDGPSKIFSIGLRLLGSFYEYGATAIRKNQDSNAERLADGKWNRSREEKRKPTLPLVARDRPDPGRRDEIWSERYSGGGQKGTATHPGASACPSLAPNATPARETAQQRCDTDRLE